MSVGRSKRFNTLHPDQMTNKIQAIARFVRAVVHSRFWVNIMTKATKARRAVKPKQVRVRILARKNGHEVNDLATMSADEARAAEKGGWADSSAAAVKHAAALPQNAK